MTVKNKIRKAIAATAVIGATTVGTVALTAGPASAHTACTGGAAYTHNHSYGLPDYRLVQGKPPGYYGPYVRTWAEYNGYTGSFTKLVSRWC